MTQGFHVDVDELRNVSLADTTAPENRAVIRLIMTATADQFAGLVPDFQQFLGSVRPDSDVYPE